MAKQLKLFPTSLEGLTIVEREPLADRRGSLQRIFCAEELHEVGWISPIAQINTTHTLKLGTVRGLHYQRQPYAEMKLVTCLQGRAFDVAVDLRAGTATFLQWFAVELSPDNHRSVLIPRGFAHGVQALSDGVELLYLHSAPHNPSAEGGISPLDGRIGIKWPLPVINLSERDSAYPSLSDSFQGLVV